MKVVVQRSLHSYVSINQKIISSISRGMVILVCIEKNDNSKSVLKAAEKLINLRIFPDDSGRMNHNISQALGEVLAVSQFTLSWSGKTGNRPSFKDSMEPQMANVYFEELCELLAKDISVSKGEFGEKMQVTITNDGPVTLYLEF